MASSSTKSAAKAKILGKRELGDNLWTKPILKKHKEKSKEEETVEELDEPTLHVRHLSGQTKISDIINFFKSVGEVVRVQLIVHHRGVHAGYGFVEFASANEAKKALEKKNGEYLHGNKIFLGKAKIASYTQRPNYCIDHKVWYEDYLQRESLLIEEDETVEGLVEEDTTREKTLFVANLSPQTNIVDIADFFIHGGIGVSVRLIVNHEGKHVGCGFIEFASSDKAKKALENKNGEYLLDHKIFLGVAPKKAPNPRRSKYNLVEKLWYEDYLRRERFLIEDETVAGPVEEVAVREKTLFVDNLSTETEISDIISSFKNVGEVVHVRLTVDDEGKHVGRGFVEFSSSNEAKKALKKKNGDYLRGDAIFLGEANLAPCIRPNYCLDHKVWYEDYLRRESRLIEEKDETVDELVEEVTTRQKTLFVDNLSYQTKIPSIISFFKKAAHVVSVRLIVDDEGEHVGCGFVEFASSNEAKKVLEEKCGENLHGCEVFLDVVKIAPYPLRPKYNLAEKLWKKMIEEHQRENPLVEEEYLEEAQPILRFCGTKTIFVDN